MPLTMYQASVPVMLQMFGSITAVLDKAAAFCEERKVDPTILVNYRLAADMRPLSSQIQIMTDQAKGAAARLAGIEIPSYADDEVTLDDLKARIAKTVEFVKSIKPEQVNGAEDREVVLKIGWDPGPGAMPANPLPAGRQRLALRPGRGRGCGPFARHGLCLGTHGLRGPHKSLEVAPINARQSGQGEQGCTAGHG